MFDVPLKTISSVYPKIAFATDAQETIATPDAPAIAPRILGQIF
jgi:hypothetical protein